MTNAGKKPPSWADHFLEWYCNPELLEEIQGDLHERYYERIDEKGLKNAKWWYILNVFLFMNKYTLSRKGPSYTRLNSLDMFRSYFKTGIRSALKHKWPTLINTTGLALAIGSTLVVYVFLENTYYNDSIHENLEEIYLVEKTLQKNDGRALYCSSPEPLGPGLKAAFSHIKNAARFTHDGGTFQYQDQVFQEWVTFADPSLFDIFSYPFIWGEPEHFMEPDAIFLSESLAAKYFGRENPVGKEIKIRFSRQGKEYSAGFQVRGVLKKLSMNSSFFFNALIPFDRQLALGKSDFADWQVSTSATFVQIPEASQIPDIEANMGSIIEKANADRKAWPIAAFQFQPLSGIGERISIYEDNMFSGSHQTAIIMLVMISAILLLLVCFNYMNTTIATAVSRLKEISMRKVMGSNRRQLVFQFLAENSIVCFVGLLLGFLLAQNFFFDFVDSMVDQPFIAALGFSINLRFCFFLVFLLFLIILGGSAYPAFYISSLQPIAIMQDRVKMASKNQFRKVLLGIQFMLTFVMIFTTFAFSGHMEKLKNTNWGYEPDSKLVVRVKNGDDFSRFQQELEQLPEIEQVTGASQQIGKSSSKVTIVVDGEKFDIEELVVGLDHLEAMKIPLLAGRYSDSHTELDQEQSMIINEQLRKKLGWKNAIGKTIKLENRSYSIIGEIANVRHKDFFQTIQPMAYRFCPKEDYRYMTAHLTTTNLAAITPKVDQAWKKVFPDRPFNYFYQDEVFNDYFDGMNTVTKVLSSASMMAVFISAIGLFGLVMLVIASRMKEISIRKVLGANLKDIGRLVNREFFWPMTLSIIIGAPAGYFLVKLMLQQFSPENTTIGLLPLLLTTTAMLLTAILSVSGHIYNANRKDPIVHLRDE